MCVHCVCTRPLLCEQLTYVFWVRSYVFRAVYYIRVFSCCRARVFVFWRTLPLVLFVCGRTFWECFQVVVEVRHLLLCVASAVGKQGDRKERKRNAGCPRRDPEASHSRTAAHIHTHTHKRICVCARIHAQVLCALTFGLFWHD